MDIKDFFPSIKLPRVIALFQWAGYCDEASYAMARCCLLEDRLPQGAATSPLIANLVSWRLDARLSALARSFALRYSRYADDMVFSGDRISAGVSRVVESVVRSEGFQINAEKTYLARGQKKKVVTGINVSSEVTRLPRSKRRAFRAFAHRALNDPLGRSPDAAQRRDPQHLQRLLASLAYWIQVEPSSAVARGYHQRTKELVAQLRQATVLPDPNPPQAP
jgi:retron-type reverse transcriptase